MPELIEVSVVYALAERQSIVSIRLPAGSTVEQAVAQASQSAGLPELVERSPTCAVYGRIVRHDHVLAPGDRVELLRPLQIDPKESRRQAAGRTRPKR